MSLGLSLGDLGFEVSGPLELQNFMVLGPRGFWNFRALPRTLELQKKGFHRLHLKVAREA